MYQNKLAGHHIRKTEKGQSSGEVIAVGKYDGHILGGPANTGLSAPSTLNNTLLSTSLFNLSLDSDDYYNCGSIIRKLIFYR